VVYHRYCTSDSRRGTAVRWLAHVHGALKFSHSQRAVGVRAGPTNIFDMLSSNQSCCRRGGVLCAKFVLTDRKYVLQGVADTPRLLWPAPPLPSAVNARRAPPPARRRSAISIGASDSLSS